MNGHGLVRRTLVGGNPRPLSDPAIVSPGAEYDLKLCAVTDSKLIFLKRSLGAASAGHHFFNLESVIAFVVEPEYVCYL